MQCFFYRFPEHRVCDWIFSFVKTVMLKTTKKGTPVKVLIYRRNLLPWGYAVAQLVEALHYKPEGRGFDSRWSHWNFSVT
jgi:hypothetical protein